METTISRSSVGGSFDRRVEMNSGPVETLVLVLVLLVPGSKTCFSDRWTAVRDRADIARLLRA